MKNEAEFPEIFPAMRSQTRFLAAFFASVFAASVASAAEEISPVEMARKLNTAFVEVADRVSASEIGRAHV